MKEIFKKNILGIAVFAIALTAFFSFTQINSQSTENPIFKSLEQNEESGIVDMYNFQFERLKNPKTGEIPNNIRQLELTFAAELAEKEKLNNNSVQTFQWTSEGPNNQGGRTKDIIEDISNSNILLAAAAEGGVWRSENAGASWTPTTDPSFMQNVNCLTQDTRPGKTNTWYYGTGEYASNLWINGSQLQRFQGNGIYKSTDNGKTWKGLASTISDSPAWVVSEFQFVWDVEVDRTITNQDRVYAACFSGILVSNDGGENWTNGIGGIQANLGAVSQYTSVSVSENGIAFAALSSGETSGVYHSSNGVNWTDITPNFWPAQVNRIETAVSKSNPDILYIISNTPSVGHPASADDGENGYTSLWKYDHSNGSWVNLSSNLPDFNEPAEGFSSQWGYDLIIEVKPDDEDFVVIGGTNIYTSNDGFASKLDGSRWVGGYAKSNNYNLYANHHPDQHGLFFSYTNPNVVYSAMDGGISRTNDITASSVTWTSLNSGYVTTQFWNIALEHKTAGNNVIIGGMQDNGTWKDVSANSTSSWTNLWGGDGCYAAVADNNVFYYVSSQNGNVYRYTDGGQWTQVTPTGASDFLFITPFLLDPTNTNSMYFLAGQKVWKNTGLSDIPNFIQEPTSVNWSSFDGAIEGWRASALAISKSAPNILYVGDSDGNLYKISNTSDMSSTFENITGNGFPNAYISSIDVSHNDVNNVIVGISNYQTHSLFHSFDGGATWSEVGGNLEENSNGSGNGPSIRNVKILPVNGSIVYLAATSIGLFTTTSLNGSNTVWTLESSQQMGNVVVETMDVRYADGRVVVGTFGKGAYSSSIVSGVEDETEKPNSFTLSQNYPNPFNPTTKIAYHISDKFGSSTNVNLTVYNSIGEVVTVLADGTQAAGNYEVEFNASGLSSGVYYYTLTAGSFTQTSKMMLLK